MASESSNRPRPVRPRRFRDTLLAVLGAAVVAIAALSFLSACKSGGH